MRKEKSVLDKFDKREKLSKLFPKLAFITFWVFLVIGIILLIYGLSKSFGNIADIINKLNSKKFTGEELQANYNMLIEKYGEWVIGKGSTGFVVRFINIKKAVFSGFMVLSLIGSGASLFISLFCGKWLFPLLAKKYKDDNDNQAHRETIKMAMEIEELKKGK